MNVCFLFLFLFQLCLHLAVFYLYHEEPPFARVCQMESPLTASPLLQPVQPWESGFGMDGYMVRGVPEQQRTRSNSTVSAGSMGGMAGLDGASMACKVWSLVSRGDALASTQARRKVFRTNHTVRIASLNCIVSVIPLDLHAGYLPLASKVMNFKFKYVAMGITWRTLEFSTLFT